MLTSDQLHEIVDIFNKQMLFFVGSTLGPSVLSDQDLKILKEAGIDVDKIYSESKDPVVMNFYLGMLSNILSDSKVKSFTFDQLKKYVESGEYVPLNAREKAVLNSIKMQSLADVRASNGRIFQDINNVAGNTLSSLRANQEEFIRDKIVEGVSKRQSIKKITREIAKMSGDWSRNFGKSVQYISHTALNEGRVAMIERRYKSSAEARVYFLVQKDACENCVRLYLTNGSGSEPIVFKLSELQANGTNIGRKQKDWRPTVGPIHVHCRCLIAEYLPGSIWDGEKFVLPKDRKPAIKREKIRVVFDGKEYYV